MLPTPWRRLSPGILCALLLGGALPSLAADTPKVIRLRADSWMPYNGVPSASLPGYAVELARAIFSAHGYTVDYQAMTWADALKAAGAGEIEGVIGANKTEAKGLVVPREMIGEPMVGLYVRKDSTWTFENIGSLTKVRLGVVDGYSYWDTLDSYLTRQGPPQVSVLRGDTPLLDGIGQLDRAELDVIAESQPVWLWTVKSSGRANRDYRSVYLQPGESIYLAFSPQSGPELAALWDRGIAELRANGQLAEILRKYSISDWK